MTLSLSLRKPTGMLHLSRGQTQCSTNVAFLKVLPRAHVHHHDVLLLVDARFNSIGPVVNAILSSKYWRAFTGSFLVKVFVISFFCLCCFGFHTTTETNHGPGV